MTFVFRSILFFLLLTAHLQLSYNFNQSWWHSAAGTGVLLVLGFAIWGKRFPGIGGLAMTRNTLFVTTGLALVVTALALFVMRAEGDGKVSISHSSLYHYAHNFFYIINEEVITGAILLYLIHRRFSLSPFFASGLIALVMALAHLALYKWYFRDHGLLSASAVLSLFLIAFAKNNLIVRYGHIGYAWALHFGWMVVMYGSVHRFADSGLALTDLEKFNLYLGAPATLILAAALTAGTLFIGGRKMKGHFTKEVPGQGPV